MKRAFSVAWGRTREHASELERGLAALGAGYFARICPLCKGEGQYEQTYTNGCGMGTSRMSGPCDFCNAAGLLQGNRAAPDSVRNQVLTASPPTSGESQ